MKWGVPAYQRTSSFHKYTRARTCIYFRKLLVRWYAGTLLTFYSLSTHSPMPTQNSTFWGWCGHAFDPRETRERPAKDPRKTHGKVREGEILIIVRLLRFTPRPAFQAPTRQHNPIMNRQGKKKGCRASHTCKTAFSYRSITAAVIFDHAYLRFSSSIPESKQWASRWQKSSNASAIARASTGVTYPTLPFGTISASPPTSVTNIGLEKWYATCVTPLCVADLYGCTMRSAAEK